jgi:hypothetical protein
LSSSGGGDKVVPSFGVKNDPFKSTTERSINKTKYQESQMFGNDGYHQKPAKPGTGPIVDLQVYEAMKPQIKRADPSLFMPVMTMDPNQLPRHQGLNLYEGNFNYAAPPVINNYSFNVGGPFGDHNKIKQLYQDYLPKEQFTGTFDTIQERNDFHNYFRSRILEKDDGEELNLVNTKNENSKALLSFVKFIELNPYRPRDTTNPYHGLRENGFLIYSSCYPIRFNKNDSTVMCAKDSLGLTIRLYETTTDNDAFNIREDDDAAENIDIWRDIKYYDYVKNYIVKEKVCPNFVIMHAYFRSSDSHINFADQSKPKIKKLTSEELLKQSRNPIQQSGPQNSTHPPPLTHHNMKTDEYINNNNNNIDSKNVIVAITESVTHNIIAWGSQIAELDKKYHVTLKNQLNIGYHKENIWFSVLFQLAFAMCVMQTKNITFTDFSLKNNVFIKDIKYGGQNNKFWKYKLDNYTYYIPNEGYLVMIDSSFNNPLDKANDADNRSAEGAIGNFLTTYESKDCGNKFNPDICKPKFANDKIKNLIFESFKKIFSKKSFDNNKMVSPPESVLLLLDRINTDSSKKDSNESIRHYINKYFTMFSNNKIGKGLSYKEIRNVRKDLAPNLIGGEMIAKQIQNGKYEFVMFDNINDNDKQLASVYTLNQENKVMVDKKPIRIDSLFNYDGEVKQSGKFSDRNLLETYTLYTT